MLDQHQCAHLYRRQDVNHRHDQHYWARLLKRLGIRYRRPCNMRHSYATSMLMTGMTPAFCARQLGHTVEMFLRTYAKWIGGSQNDLDMAWLEAALTRPGASRARQPETSS